MRAQALAFRWLWLLTATAVAAAGCASLPHRSAERAPQPLPPELAAYYSYPEKPHDVTRTLLRDKGRYREYLVSFPLSYSGFEPTEPQVEFEWFESAAPGKRASIVFNPILGGDYPLERGICRFLASRGFHTAMVHRKTLKVSPDKPVEHIELLLRQGIIRIRQVVDWMEVQENVDSERIGAFGISMGAIATSILAATDPRIKAHVVALAGGSIADILESSNDKLLTKPIKRYLSQNKMDRAELNKRVRESIRTDPVLLAPYTDSRHMRMFIALADRTIGRENSFRLWEAVGRPRVSLMPCGHYTAYLALPYLKYAGISFLSKELNQPVLE